uniref:DUF4939 domain-containing protein n=1 Tax=Periophthalmus magnuspinnatus TaxID=409849 RepID=A0A3B4BES6_9GOBI
GASEEVIYRPRQYSIRKHNSRHAARAPALYRRHPDPYAGQPGLCRGFLFQCLSVFQQRPARFPSDAARIRYVCGLLRGRALQWAEAKFSNSALENTDFETFLNEFKLVFSHPHYRADAASCLLSITQ